MKIIPLFLMLLVGGSMSAEPGNWVSNANVLKFDVLKFDDSGASKTPFMIIRGPDSKRTVTIMYTREKLEELAKDDHGTGMNGYAILALEIVRLREKCGEQLVQPQDAIK